MMFHTDDQDADIDAVIDEDDEEGHEPEEPELEEKIVIEEIDNSMSPLPKRQCGAGAWPTPTQSRATPR